MDVDILVKETGETGNTKSRLLHLNNLNQITDTYSRNAEVIRFYSFANYIEIPKDSIESITITIES